MVINWKDIKDRVDLARVAAALLGPAAQRQGRRLLWCCPFHDDRHPSLVVDPRRQTWRCWPCNLGGDAIALVRQLEPWISFPEAVRRVVRLSDLAVPAGGPMDPPRGVGRGAGWRGRTARAEAPGSGGLAVEARGQALLRERSEPSSGLPLADALALAAEAQKRLWTPAGSAAREYLHGRILADQTIQAARLGYVASVWIPTRDQDRSIQASGVVIPWFEADRLSLVKVRQGEGAQPKYVEAFRDRPRIFPGLQAIQPARPLIIVEGELDALLLAQELRRAPGLPGWAAVVTLGSASNRPDPALYQALMLASWLFLALDGDAASGPPRPGRRGRPAFDRRDRSRTGPRPPKPA